MRPMLSQDKIQICSSLAEDMNHDTEPYENPVDSQEG